jgi:hypothetical protein
MDEGVNQRLLRQVVASTVGACDACSTPFDELAVSVAGHEDDLWFFSVVCDRCHTRVLVAALVRDAAPVAIGESSSRDHPAAVAGDDVHAVRQFLDAFDGDFQSLFG